MGPNREIDGSGMSLTQPHARAAPSHPQLRPLFSAQANSREAALFAMYLPYFFAGTQALHQP